MAEVDYISCTITTDASNVDLDALAGYLVSFHMRLSSTTSTLEHTDATFVHGIGMDVWDRQH